MQQDKSFLRGDFNGTLFAFCEMVRRMNKPLAFSKPFDPGDEAELGIFAKANTAEFGLQYYLEKELLLTKLFASVDMKGRWVYIIYRDKETLDRYFELKGLWEECTSPDGQDMLSRRYASLMGYCEDAVDELFGAPPCSL